MKDMIDEMVLKVVAAIIASAPNPTEAYGRYNQILRVLKESNRNG